MRALAWRVLQLLQARFLNHLDLVANELQPRHIAAQLGARIRRQWFIFWAAQYRETVACLAQLDVEGANAKPDQRRLSGSRYGFALAPASGVRGSDVARLLPQSSGSLPCCSASARHEASREPPASAIRYPVGPSLLADVRATPGYWSGGSHRPRSRAPATSAQARSRRGQPRMRRQSG